MWIIMAWQHISPEVIVKDCMNSCMSSAMDETGDNICGMAVKTMAILAVSVRKTKTL
jgi:hypothetical protein